MPTVRSSDERAYDNLLSLELGRARRVQRNLLLEDVSRDLEDGEAYCEECLHKQGWWEEVGIHPLQREGEQRTSLQTGRVFNMTWGWPDLIGVITFLLVLFTFLHEWGIVT